MVACILLKIKYFAYLGDYIMRRIFVVMLGIILLFGCSTIGGTRNPPANFFKAVSLNLGMSWDNREVVKLDKGSPAERAGVKLGDIFISNSFEGKKITSKEEFNSLKFKMRPGDHILYVMDRDGKQIEFNIKPNVLDALPTYFEIDRLLQLENRRVTLAVIVSQVKNTRRGVSKDWYDARRMELQSEYEANAIRYFSDQKDFSIVDRSRLTQILDEFQFSRSGFVSDKLRTKIGEMTGATHIMDISYTQYESGLVTTSRLIEIESGKVLAVDRWAID
jgi:hypothetical protein